MSGIRWKHWDLVNKCGKSIVCTGASLLDVRPRAFIYQCEICKHYFVKDGKDFRIYYPTQLELNIIDRKIIKPTSQKSI